jgi:hypothetical protein
VSELLFTPLSVLQEDGMFTSCLGVMAVEDMLIEPDETASVEIDPDSLMSNDAASPPSTVEVNIKDNDGM